VTGAFLMTPAQRREQAERLRRRARKHELTDQHDMLARAIKRAGKGWEQMIVPDSSIEWPDATWNPVAGCSVISPGCTNCYGLSLGGPHVDDQLGR
jgi:hypothetical protein